MMPKDVKQLRDENKLKGYGDVVENMECAISVTHMDADGHATAVYHNPAFVRICDGEGKDVASAYKKDLLKGVAPEYAEDLNNLFQQAARGVKGELTYLYTSFTGRQKWLAAKLNGVMNPDGSADVYASFFDITKQQTERLQQELEKNAMLSQALETAKQANLAKSQFLSRMSHELRTPMNAIIGLSALAASDVKNPEAMADAIGKIGMSARYLLSLINDILEMSRIESGRMLLHEGPFDFNELITAVNTIVYRQATDKGVDYDSIVRGFMEQVYVGDVTKLQQIMVNVLGNAVKFTKPGGKVTLIVEQIRRVNDKASIRFTISDTGVGIDKKFLPNLFEPFTQESASYTSVSTGTGLGLTITKSMVEMMNGSIKVQSLKNIGTMFTIEVQLTISEEKHQYFELLAAMNLSKMKTLVVDDDVLVCQSTRDILLSMGMSAQWADSGHLALEMVKEAQAANKDFDTIFIDWKMPDMDGIETTRAIRRLVGPDVTIIIMTAYDWADIENEARAAGVDMFMEKPLFPAAITTALETLFRVHKDKLVPRPRRIFDFTGRHLLLAEDHPLNVEVAKRLLEKVGAKVEVAHNGLEAIEAFTIAEEGYFDAILMDIRMPVMDGLTASKHIRMLKKKGSSTIPIIAMTANAFDEDVQQSLNHGMDAHLIKPIDPMVLYETLQRFMKHTGNDEAKDKFEVMGAKDNGGK